MKQKLFNYPLFALGFRPFFLLATLSAILLMLLWNAILNGKIPAHLYYPGAYWHAHEILIGYCTAVVAGFLLTAIKNWTGIESITGEKLAGFCLLWLYGRIVPFYADALPEWLCALVDFAFLPALTLQLSKFMLTSQQRQNIIFLVLLGIMTIGNAMIHAQFLELSTNTADNGLLLITATLIIAILTLTGRLIPFFAERGLKGYIAIRNQQLDGLAITTALAVFSLELLNISGVWLALAAITAAILNGLKMSGWYTQRIWYVPLLWVLVTGYAWIIIGFVLTALAAYNLVDRGLALHAFALGGISILTLGMMARIALTQTGRALKASNTLAVAFVCLNLAAICRVLLPIALNDHVAILTYGATLLWLGAFTLFTVVYLPIINTKYH